MNVKSNVTGAGKRKKVFLADHFALGRMALVERLKRTGDLAVCGEADNSASALDAIRRLRPDVVVTEIFRQQDLGFVRALREQHPRLPILVFSFRDEQWYAPRALEAGADGYLSKSVSKDTLVDGIRGVLEGHIMLSPEMRSQLFPRIRQFGTLIGAHRDWVCTLK